MNSQLALAAGCLQALVGWLRIYPGAGAGRALLPRRLEMLLFFSFLPIQDFWAGSAGGYGQKRNSQVQGESSKDTTGAPAAPRACAPSLQHFLPEHYLFCQLFPLPAAGEARPRRGPQGSGGWGAFAWPRRRAPLGREQRLGATIHPFQALVGKPPPSQPSPAGAAQSWTGEYPKQQQRVFFLRRGKKSQNQRSSHLLSC